jgi:hypothetical protein
MKITEHQLRQIIRQELTLEVMGPSAAAIKRAKSAPWPTISTNDIVSGLEWGLLGTMLVSDFIPVLGTLGSTAAAIALGSIAAAKENWLGVALAAASIAVPFVGDSLAIVGKAVQSGIKVSLPVLQKVAQGLARVSGAKLKQTLTANATSLAIPPERINHIATNASAALDKFKTSVNNLIKA